jgi:hypothetical protein
LEAICGWTDDFSDDERSFPGGRELMHVVGLLDTPEDEGANVEGSFSNVVIVIPKKLLVVTSLSHDGSEPLFFKAVKFDSTCLIGFSLLVELNAWNSKGDVGR